MENPKCIVCNESICIIHPTQKTKKYCGYQCQQKFLRENKKKKEDEIEILNPYGW